MAKSKYITALSVLRSHLGEYKNEVKFGALIGKSESWTKKVCCKRIHINRDTALRISLETGVCPEWLLANNTQVPPKTVFGGEYTAGTFEEYRKTLKASKPTMVDALLAVGGDVLPELMFQISKHYHTHRTSSETVGNITAYLQSMMTELAEKFPITKDKNLLEIERSALQLCRRTSRAWIPSDKSR